MPDNFTLELEEGTRIHVRIEPGPKWEPDLSEAVEKWMRGEPSAIAGLLVKKEA